MKENSPLGKKTGFSDNYDPKLLFPIERSEGRKSFKMDSLNFDGADIWNCYELSWLNSKGKPLVAILRVTVPCTSRSIIESKSLKLYLNSFNQTEFDSIEVVTDTIKKDLSEAAGSRVDVSVIPPEKFSDEKIHPQDGECIDDLDVEIDTYQPDPSLLKTEDTFTKEKLYSNLLRTNCPVTDQPDWATIHIEYSGNAINRKSLLRYLISFRKHSGFHENCVESIFCDIMERCKPSKLLVYARFTRRGGIDINPFRSNYGAVLTDMRDIRQ